MSQRQNPDALPGFFDAWVTTLQCVMFIVHGFAWPFRLLYTVPGHLGRMGYGLDCLAGLMFGYPLMAQQVSSRLDGLIVMRLWAVLWWWLVAQVITSWLWNRRNRVHSREIGSKTWLGHFCGPILMPCLIAFAAYFFLRPRMSGLGNLFVWSPLAYVVSNWLVELKMRHSVIGATDAPIEAEAFQRRLGG